MDELQRVREASEFVRARGAGETAIAIVLGSGLKKLGDLLEDRVELPFRDVPHWPAPRVEGHGASLILGTLAQTRVACLTGRVHLYEGWQPAEVVRAVRSLRLAGVDRFLLTNAAGGIGTHLQAGDLMVLRDHINLTGASPLVGPHVAEFGPRFPDQSKVYASALSTLLEVVDPDLEDGVYAGLLGPSYETPAEVAMLRAIGADAVGMSTVHEAIALNAMGAKVAGVSLISNLAAGIADTALSHDEVMAAGQAAQARFLTLVQGFCAALGRDDHD